MTIKITNQKPAEIYAPHNILPKINISLSEDEYIEKQKDYIKTKIVEPLFVPLNAQTDVKMEDVSDPANPIPFDQDAIVEGIWHLWTDDSIDPDLDAQLTDIFYQSLRYSQTNNWRIEEQQALENLSKLKFPLPSTGQNGRIVKYTPKIDIIPTAKSLLADTSNSDTVSEWFGVLSGYLRDKMTNITLLTVQSSYVWDQVKTNIDQIRQTLNQQNTISSDTNNLLSDFDKISLDGELSTGIFLPAKGAEQSHSFTRIVMNLLSVYEENHPDELLVQPLNTMEYMIPRNIVVLNLEEYAHATDKEIIKDWADLENAFKIKSKLNMVSHKKLMTAQRINSSMSPSTQYTRNTSHPVVRRAQQPFSQKPITSKQSMLLMSKVIKAAKTNKQTENMYKTPTRSFMRANRRDPNNINLSGKVTTTSYRPDIHIYLDTSGSISESQYRDAVGSLIMLTKKINANLYITSFSHVISQTTLLQTKDKSISDIYKSFLSTPKVSGGTEFENVWNKIDQLDVLNQKHGKSYQVNFIITDFGYGLRRDRSFHKDQPSHKYTYYVPISSDPYMWKHITRMAKEFSKQMASAGASGVRKHMLM